MDMTLILEDALPTSLSHGKHTLSGKRFRNVASFLLRTTREVRHGIVGLHALSQGMPYMRVTRPHVCDWIEIRRACWTFYLFDTLSFEVVVGHVSTLRTHVDVREDKCRGFAANDLTTDSST